MTMAMFYSGSNSSEMDVTLVELADNTTTYQTTNHTTNHSTSPSPLDCSNFYSQFKVTVFHVKFYLLAVVILSGLVLNTLAFVCFMTSQTLRNTTTGHYLIALAVADFTFLVGDFVRWINAETVLGIKFYDEYNFWCKIIYFLRYFGKLVSAWITVAITIERFVSVVYPLKAGRLSTKRKTRIVISGIYLCCAALTIFPFWTIGLTSGDEFTCIYCGYLDQHVYDMWNWSINRVGSLFIPSLIIFIFTTILLGKLRRIRKRRNQLTRQQSVSTSLESQLTTMLILVAVAFLLLRLPYTITFYLHDFWPRSDPDGRTNLWAARQFSDIIATTNYSINFFLYCLAGSSFRSQFVLLICCCKKEELGYSRTSMGITQTVVTRVHSRNKAGLSVKNSRFS